MIAGDEERHLFTVNQAGENVSIILLGIDLIEIVSEISKHKT